MLSNSSQGLGEIVQRKKAAYQDNPQGLQQRYQQSQQLTDLLALQQLKSEKEAAARNMQMAMQQNPATIAKQREQEVLGLIKQEQGRNLGKVSQQVGGVLGQRQKESTQRRQQMGMAQGGIVGFTAGGTPRSEFAEGLESVFGQDENIDDITRGLMGLREEAKGLPGLFTPSTSEQRNIRDRLEIGSSRARDLAFRVAENPELLTEYKKLGPREFALKYIDPETRDVKPVALKSEPKPKPKKDAATAMIDDAISIGTAAGMQPQPTAPAAATTPTAAQGIGRLKVAEPDFAGTTAQRDIAKGILTDVGIDPSRDSDEERKERIADTKKEMGLEGLLKRKDDQLSRLKTQQEELSRGSGLDRFIAGATGAAQRGGPGGYGAGSLAERKSQKAQQRLDLTAQFGIEDAKMKLEFDVTAKGIESGDKLANVISQERQHYAKIMQDATKADYDQASAVADRVMQSDQQNIQTDLALLADTTKRAIEDAKGKRDEADQLYSALQNNMEKRLEVLGPVYELIGIDRASGDFSSDEMKEKLRQAQITQAELSEASNLFALEESMIARLEALGRPVETMRTDLNRSRAVLEGLRTTDATLKGQK